MARTVIITDDVTGEQGAKPRVIALDGTEYEVDLTDASFAELKRAMKPYLKNARVTKGKQAGRPAARKRGTARSNGATVSQQARAWAAENGVDVPKRGRVPASVVEAFQAATQQ